MDIVIHRVNTIVGILDVERSFGAEIDVRAWGSELILNHAPFARGDTLASFLEVYEHGLLVLNIKEDGIEDETLRLVRQAGVERFFLLDVEFPYIYRASRQGERAIAARYSEDESIETVLNYKGMVDWVWIDTNTVLPLNDGVVGLLEGFKCCLVCPERWGRPGDIKTYRHEMAALSFEPDAVMTSRMCVEAWSEQLADL